MLNDFEEAKMRPSKLILIPALATFAIGFANTASAGDANQQRVYQAYNAYTQPLAPQQQYYYVQPVAYQPVAVVPQRIIVPVAVPTPHYYTNDDIPSVSDNASYNAAQKSQSDNTREIDPFQWY
jgi:hypothetical protein